MKPSMTHSTSYLFLVLGMVTAVAGACSSSTAKPTPEEPTTDAGSSGDASSGASSSGAGGTAPSSGAGSAGEAVGGDAATSMTDGWLSGARLRAVLQVAGDAKLFTDWHDTKLDIECSFAFDAHGVERCLPFDAYGSPGASYSDAECTQPAAVFDTGTPVPLWVKEPARPFSCHVGPRYLPVGADVEVTELYRNSSGACESAGVIGATQIAKALGAPVPESTFVAAVATRQEPRDERLAANVRYAEDGSRQVLSHVDLQRAADCDPRLHTGDGYACVPKDLAYIQTFYANDACDVPVAYQPGSGHQTCDRTPKLIQFSKPNYTDTYFELGTQLKGSVYRDTGTCEAYVSPGDPGAKYFNVGEAVPWSSLPQLSSKNEGTGRILIQVLRGADSELISRETFFDTEHDMACSPLPASDSKPRCLPSFSLNVNAFADAKCTTALYATASGSVPPAAFLQANAPGGGTLVFKLAGKIAPPGKVWDLNGADCVERGVVAAEDYYSTTAIAATEMAPVTLETE